MWPTRQRQRQELKDGLARHVEYTRVLPGIVDPAARDTLVEQIVASLRREDYHRLSRLRDVGAARADPADPLFVPEKAVAYHAGRGNVDEAAWLVFLMTHFGKQSWSGWKRLTDVYGKLGAGVWDWESTSASPAAFGAWLDANWRSVGGKFGSHRKYESIRPRTRRGTARIVAAYVDWVQHSGGHSTMIAGAVREAGNDPHRIFDTLYRRVEVPSFGRLAKFDYVSLLGRYGLAPATAGSAYLDGATGPARGARLLFAGNPQAAVRTVQLQSWLDELDGDLGVGMEVLEDALCNWQKNPAAFVHFKG